MSQYIDANSSLNTQNRDLKINALNISIGTAKTPSATGATGAIHVDTSGYLYVCVAENDWKRLSYTGAWS